MRENISTKHDDNLTLTIQLFIDEFQSKEMKDFSDKVRLQKITDLNILRRANDILKSVCVDTK